MKQEPAITSDFRKLHIDLPPVRRENSIFWWLAGTALAVCFLGITLHYYAAHKKAPAKMIYKNHKSKKPGTSGLFIY